ncbi:tyrosine-type recombinase/integrase [Mycobacterium intracellulare]|uniref:tyrosine-type recombinase/integrase n=1 Tax=Mycobacterium intracellulare TaxID=1767 RepID=UPI0006DA5951|nr:site-specific integrase [Mycobacterium intracellulare]KPN46506.1 integrase [Mycobacterium intracellulare subsp. chimaera]
MAAVILHCFDPVGWEEWGLSRRPLIRSGMPVLVDDDLKFEDESGERPTVAMNRWLRELPVSGAPARKTWLTYAQVLKAWSEFLAEQGVGVFADRTRLRAVLSMYAEHRLSGAARGRWGGASWNLAVNTLSGFYRWAQEAGYVAEVPFSYARHYFTRPDGMRVETSQNLATVRTARPHARRKYLERPYVDLLLHALAGNDAAGEPDRSFRGRETGRNHALVGLALGSGLRAQEFTYLTVYEVPALPSRRTEVPIPLVLAPPTTKGSKGRSTWIGFDALARVHDYIAWDRAVTVDGSRWMPHDALIIEAATVDGVRIDSVVRRWHTLTPAERVRLVAPGGGTALLAARAGGGPFVDWATVLRRTAARVRKRYDPAFPHVHPHVMRHSFAMATLEQLVRGYYQRAAQLELDTGGDNAMALYLTKADPLLVLRDLLGHSSASVTQIYLHLIDTQRIYRDAYTNAGMAPAEARREAMAEFAETEVM